MAELKEHVNATWTSMTPSFSKRVTRILRSRLERVVAAGGCHIKKFIKYHFFYIKFTTIFVKLTFL